MGARRNDPAIKAENSGATLPSEAIKTYHRADGSGTTKVFSGFLDATAKSVWKLGADKEIAWTTGQGATGSDGVTQGVKNTEGGITYAEVSYAKQNNLPDLGWEHHPAQPCHGRNGRRLGDRKLQSPAQRLSLGDVGRGTLQRAATGRERSAF